MTPSRGFTLVELLVALFVTAILFAMGYGAINQAIDNREALLARQERLVEVQRAMRILVQDFAQLAPRPVRDEIGSVREPALVSGTPTGLLVRLTRSGWSNPAGVQRPSLQRVHYLLVDGHLRRQALPVLDGASIATARSRELLEGVKAVTIRYMTDGRSWVASWPPQNGKSIEENDRARPVAVEVTLELDDWGKILRLIEVAN